MFTSKDFVEIRKDFKIAMKDFSEKYNLKVEMGTINFSGLEFSSKVKFESNDKKDDSNMRKEFEKHCGDYGLAPTDYKKRFTTKTTKTGVPQMFELVGFEITRPVNPLVAIMVKTGKEYIFRETLLKNNTAFNGKAEVFKVVTEEKKPEKRVTAEIKSIDKYDLGLFD